MEELKEKVVEKIDDIIAEEGIQTENINMLGKLVDIHKDLENECYWKEKIDIMRYNNYEGNYGRRSRDSRGRYSEESYGRRMDTRYPGEEMIDDVYGAYRDYSHSGNYGNKQGTMKSLEYMLESIESFIEMLEKDAQTQEEVDLIKKYTREISEM